MRRHHHQRLAQIHCLADGLETGGRRVCTATCHLAQELLVIQIIEAERVIHDLDRGLGSKYGLERGDSIDGRNVQQLHKRDYIRMLTKEAKQAEKAIKGLQTMIHIEEAQIYNYQTQLEKTDKSLTSGQIELREYESLKSEILKQISEYQSKLKDKSNKLHKKEQELELRTKDAANARSVIQPLRNYKVDFTTPQITEKPPMFGTDKWVERQNPH